jgi:hypothetical protein
MGLSLLITCILSISSINRILIENRRYDQQLTALKEQIRLEYYLKRSEKNMQSAARNRVVEVTRFLIQRKRGLKPFAEALLSWRGKLKFIQTKLSDENRLIYREYIQSQFRQHLFSEAELGQVIQQAITNYNRDVQAIENQLWVSAQKDIADLNWVKIGANNALLNPLNKELDGLTGPFQKNHFPNWVLP